MSIDDFYNDEHKNLSKSNFYIGQTSLVNNNTVKIQIENISLFKQRRIGFNNLLPGSINYFIVIDNPKGIFLGKVFQSEVNNIIANLSNNTIIDIEAKLFAKLNGERFVLTGTESVSVNNKAYVANPKLISLYLRSLETEEYQENNLLENIGELADFNHNSVSLNPNTLFSRHLLAIGSTNSGKSSSSLSIIDKMIGKNNKVLIIDPTGEYGDSFDSEKEKIEKFTFGKNLFLRAGEISIKQWCLAVNTNDGTQPAVLADAIKSLRYMYTTKDGKNKVLIKINRKVTEVDSELSNLTNDDTDFNANLLSKQINQETRKTEGGYKNKIFKFDDFDYNSKQYLVQKVDFLFNETEFKKLFKNNITNNLFNILNEFLENDKSLYLNLSTIGDNNVASMMIDIISSFIVKKLSENGIVNKLRPFVFFVDEAHRYLDYSKCDDTFGITRLAREGRKYGAFLFLTTQSPNDIPNIIFNQIGSLIIHRLTGKSEIESIKNYIETGEIGIINNLNQGEAILTSINLLQDLIIKFNESHRSHHNNTVLFD